MFTDRVTISLSAGKGGNGVVAWRREKYIPKGGPAGGDGGTGGSIHIQPTANLYSLEDYRNTKMIKAENGACGGGNNRKGKNGKDITLKVPLGTLIKDARSGNVLFDLTEENELITICRGGKGGKGNTFFKSSTNRAPDECTPGKLGESLEIEFELKLIADIGLVGMPNAGKSTLISQMTLLPVKIAPYPFTTLRPNLGILEFDDYTRVLIADIPGIIKDAHQNKGLGLSFLKHIERTSILSYMIDISNDHPFEDFLMLQNELKAYDPHLLEKPFITILNKADLEGVDGQITHFKQVYPYDSSTLFVISAKEKIGLSLLKQKFKTIISQNISSHSYQEELVPLQ